MPASDNSGGVIIFWYSFILQFSINDVKYNNKVQQKSVNLKFKMLTIVWSKRILLTQISNFHVSFKSVCW